MRMGSRGGQVQAYKHQINVTSIAVVAGTIVDNLIASTGVRTFTTIVEPSTVIKVINLEADLQPSASGTQMSWVLWKSKGGFPVAGTIDPAAITEAQSRYVIAHGQGLPINSGQPIKMFGRYRVPRILQKMGTLDAIYFSTKSTTNAHSECLSITYRERA